MNWLSFYISSHKSLTINTLGFKHDLLWGENKTRSVIKRRWDEEAGAEAVHPNVVKSF